MEEGAVTVPGLPDPPSAFPLRVEQRVRQRAHSGDQDRRARTEEELAQKDGQDRQGDPLPSQLPLEFVLPATFVALIVPGLTGVGEVASVVAGAAIAVPAVGSTTTLALAASVGALVGWSTTRSNRP